MHLGFEEQIFTRFFLLTLRAVGLQIKLGLAFWKALDVYFNFPKFQTLIRYGLKIIGLGVRPVPGGAKAEQQNL